MRGRLVGAALGDGDDKKRRGPHAERRHYRRRGMWKKNMHKVSPSTGGSPKISAIRSEPSSLWVGQLDKREEKRVLSLSFFHVRRWIGQRQTAVGVVAVKAPTICAMTQKKKRKKERKKMDHEKDNVGRRTQGERERGKGWHFSSAPATYFSPKTPLLCTVTAASVSSHWRARCLYVATSNFFLSFFLFFLHMPLMARATMRKKTVARMLRQKAITLGKKKRNRSDRLRREKGNPHAKKRRGPMACVAVQTDTKKNI